jgi:hypothetical protein
VKTGRTEIVGRSWSSRRDARDVAAAGGSAACGLDLLRNKTITKIPHGDYRVLVTAAALGQAKLRGAKDTNTSDYAIGKSKVDKLLVDRDLGVSVPCARPGRVTR